MTPEEMQAFLESRLNYERRGMPAQQELRIDRVAMLLERLGQPQKAYPIVHIAGSKGKGSTAHMVAALLESAAPQVGLHTSPHFEHLEERFRINGICADPQALASLAAELVPLVASVDQLLMPHQPELTFFEITTALFLLYFQRNHVDWAVIEVGMGGRLDSTNVVDPNVAVITSISRDHMRQLGNTLEKIAAEKAGIIKPDRPVVIGQMKDSVTAVIRDIATERGSRLLELGKDFQYRYESRGFGGRVWVETWRETWPEIELGLLGAHQAHNAAVATAAIDVLRDDGLTLDLTKAVDRLAKLRIPGRIEVLSRKPLIILDVAHNDASAAALSSALSQLPPDEAPPPGSRILIYGTSADKEWAEILQSLAKDYDHVVLTSFLSNPRAVPALDLAQQLPPEVRAKVSVTNSPADAWNLAAFLLERRKASGAKAGLVCITGSFYLAAEFRELLRNAFETHATVESLRY